METIITTENVFIVIAILGAILLLYLHIRMNALKEELIDELIDEEEINEEEEIDEEELIDEEEEINEEEEIDEEELIDEKKIKIMFMIAYIMYHNIRIIGFLLILPLATYYAIEFHNWLSWLGFCIIFLSCLNSSRKINNFFLSYSKKYED